MLRPSSLNSLLGQAFQRLHGDIRFLSNENLKDLLSKMLCVNPRRPTAAQLLKHPYLEKAKARSVLDEKEEHDEYALKRLSRRI
ncbi:unnamed protein product, partial [Mesorhabditis belari]|uniref:Uncharacterized protein n=1 Tax=Mesorhabditis belari TaxID=2138241 RepID=A0AAF3J5L3_9BILA